MRIRETAIEGAFIVEASPQSDARGSFCRFFDAAVLREAGFALTITNLAVSRNTWRHTLRGLHYQKAPHGEAKVVWCSGGRLWDAVVDMRPASPTYRGQFAIELSVDDDVALLLPMGCAHGFLTLEDQSEVTYALSGSYRPDAAAGVRWDDPGLSLAWPAVPAVISERDGCFPNVDWANLEETK